MCPPVGMLAAAGPGPPSARCGGGTVLDPRLIAFLAVAREGQLTEAARQINMSVSNVSQQITSLEADFGAQLFIRTNRGATLSPAGESLRKYAEGIEADWRLAFREVHRVAEGEEAVHVAASHTVLEVFLPRPLGLFRRRYPAVQVRLTLDNSAGVLAQVETGQVDFGIVESRLGRARDLHVTNLWKDQLGLIVSANHPFAGRTEVSFAELAQQDLIVREEGSGTRRILESALHAVDHDLSELRVIMELSSVRAIVAMVRNDVGASVLSYTLADDPQNSVCFVPLPELRLHRQIYLISRNPAEQGLAARELIAELRRDSQR